MNNPKYKFAILLAAAAFLYTLYSVFNYTLNDRMDWHTYGINLISVGFSVFLGLFFIFISARLMHAKVYEDSSTTSQSSIKFTEIPKAPLIEEGLHPIESELLFLLNSYKKWPCTDSNKKGKNLYDQSIYTWNACKKDSNATHLHRIMCLSAHLCAIHTFKEVRTPAPLWSLSAQDTLSYTRISKEKGSLSAHILSQMPSFIDLETDEQQALLHAITYRSKPHPKGTPKDAEELISFYNNLNKKGA